MQSRAIQSQYCFWENKHTECILEVPSFVLLWWMTATDIAYMLVLRGIIEGGKGRKGPPQYQRQWASPATTTDYKMSPNKSRGIHTFLRRRIRLTLSSSEQVINTPKTSSRRVRDELAVGVWPHPSVSGCGEILAAWLTARILFSHTLLWHAQNYRLTLWPPKLSPNRSENSSMNWYLFHFSWFDNRCNYSLYPYLYVSLLHKSVLFLRENNRVDSATVLEDLHWFCGS